MKIDLVGKVVLVIVFMVGIGFVIVKGLVESGVEIIINGCSEQSVNVVIVCL